MNRRKQLTSQEKFEVWLTSRFGNVVIVSVFVMLVKLPFSVILDPWVRRIPCRRKWHSTPVFLPGEFHGQGSLAGYSPWARKESDTTELLTLSLSFFKDKSHWVSKWSHYMKIIYFGNAQHPELFFLLWIKTTQIKKTKGSTPFYSSLYLTSLPLSAPPYPFLL